MPADDDLLLARAVAALPAEAREAAEGDAVGAIVADARHVRAANAYFLALVGQRRGGPGALPLSWMRLTPPEHVAADARAIAQARMAGVSSAYEKEYERPDDERVRVLLACGLVVDEPLPLFALVADAADRPACTAVRAWATASDADLRLRLAPAS